MKNLILTLLFLLAISCGRSSDDNNAQNTLLPATQNGANKAGCYINGVLHLPKNPSQPIGGPPIYGLEMYSANNGYYFRIDNFDTNIKLFIYLPNVSAGVGNYTINQSNGIGTPAGNSDQNQMYLEYQGKEFLSSPNCGTFNFTKISPPIYSGTFSATLYNKANPSETVQITLGMIDINAQTLNN